MLIKTVLCSLVRLSLLLAVLAAAILSGPPAFAEEDRSQWTLLDHLQSVEPPVFREGHTLIPLTRWGWSMNFPVRVELADHWGYALEFGGYVTHDRVDELDENPEGDNARTIALAASDPDRYPLAVLTHRPLMGAGRNLPEELRQDYYARDADGNFVPDSRTGEASWRTVSPLAPDAIFEWAARKTVEPLVRLSERAPLAIILNGGEYGLSVAGHSRRYWEQDPRVVEAKGDRSWLDFMSVEKARQEGIISDAVREAFPDRMLYLWYHFAGIPSWDGPAWSNGPEVLAVSDLPDQSLYYRHFNSGWEGNRDLLTNFTHALAQAIELGHPLSYNWVSGGWSGNRNRYSDRDRYLGFLKCLYASGQVGAVAGYFTGPLGGTRPVGEEMPRFLEQMIDLGHAQALFSHLDSFIREGDLLPGPYAHPRDPELPAYEFAAPGEGTRVFVRRLRENPEWIIVAWAAVGDERSVTIDVPELGQLTVQAHPAGAVYHATSQHEIDYEPPVVELVRLDPDPMDPTARWR